MAQDTLRNGEAMQPPFDSARTSKSTICPPLSTKVSTTSSEVLHGSPAFGHEKVTNKLSMEQKSTKIQSTAETDFDRREFSSAIRMDTDIVCNQSCLTVENQSHEVVNRQVSSSSLCSWSSFDTSITDDNLSDSENTENNEASEALSIKPGRQKKLWGQVRKAIHWSPFIQSYKKKYPWVQLAGHDGSFKAGKHGTILKKASSNEIECLCKLMKDVLRPYIPEYKGQVHENDESFTEMEDLLADFDSPSVMDCKIGIRTYLEKELSAAGKQPKIRKDLYEKMIAIDPTEPTDEERKQGGITKPRYMQWREMLSSTATLGFRIEGIKKSEQKPCKDFKQTKTKEDVGKVFANFITKRKDLKEGYLQRLKAIRATLESSPFFSLHEVIGSSLLFVHDSGGKTGIWLIDFGKTTPVPQNLPLNHRDEWKEGNREDGYLTGLDNMIDIWEKLVTQQE
ncbi:inositol-trisphosphate 3-kinase B-like [Rhopilema esculentum]|uniref:inositol-trisphosphate 3-kinase B-like n=1 Tax=Rhopilema esculentum TaxID=499914 RepID=UPI0031D61822